MPRAGLRAALQRIVEKEPVIRDIAASVPAPEPRDRERRLAYLDEFFAKAADQESLLDAFERRCIE
jgi:hypothetical protein